MMGAASEKARLPRFSLVLRIESCCDVDDLSSGDVRKVQETSQIRWLMYCNRARYRQPATIIDGSTARRCIAIVTNERRASYVIPLNSS